jgi:hypothetical protein
MLGLVGRSHKLTLQVRPYCCAESATLVGVEIVKFRTNRCRLRDCETTRTGLHYLVAHLVT